MNIGESLVEAIKEGEIVKMTESQAREEDLFVLRRISDQGIEKHRFEKKPEEDKVVDFTSSQYGGNSMLEEWKKKRMGYKNNHVIRDLVENFHWKISKARRAKGLSRKQLADELKVKESDLKMIEFGNLPSDDFIMINAIERCLGVNLKKERKGDDVRLADLQRMNDQKIKEESDKARKTERKEQRFTGTDIEILED